MPRALSSFLALLLLLVTPATGSAGMGPLYTFNGLQRIVAREWIAPFASTDGSSPEPVTEAALLLSVVVYEFDAFDKAAQGWRQVHDGLPRTGGESIPLESMGDQVQGFMGTVQLPGQTLTFAYATVQDGPFVYSITGELVGLDATQETRDIVEMLLATEPGAGEERYDPRGASSGGLWDILGAVSPTVAPATTVADLILFPLPATSDPDVSSTGEEGDSVSTSDVYGFGMIEGIRSIHGITFLPEDATVQPASGTFRIETWILPFVNAEQASDAVDPVGEALAGSIGVQARARQQASTNGVTTTNLSLAGSIQDAALPDGMRGASIQQAGDTIYAVLVYSSDGNPADVASRIAEQMANTPAGASPATVLPDGSVTGGVWDRFPRAGDPLLDGLQPAEMTHVDHPG